MNPILRKKTRLLFALCVVSLLVFLRPAMAQAPAPPSTPESVAANPDVKFDFDTSLDALASELPGLSDLSGAARMHVDLAAPTTPGVKGVDRLVTIHSDDARFARLPIGVVDVRLWNPAGAPRSKVTVDARGGAVGTIHLELELELDVDPAHAKVRWKGGAVDGKLQLAAVDLDQLTKAYPALAMVGQLDLTATIGDRSDDPTIDVSVEARRVKYRGQDIGLVSGHWGHTAGVSTLQARWGEANAPVLSALVKLPLTMDLLAGRYTWDDAKSMEVAVDAPSITPKRVQAFWEAPEGLDFNLGLSVKGGGTLDALAVRSEVKGTVKSFDSPPVPVNVTLDLGATQQQLRVALGQHLFDSTLTSRASLVALRRNGVRAEGAAVDGAVAMALPIALFRPFFPSGVVDPAGTFNGNIAVGGTLGAPTFTGAVGAKSAAVTVLALHQRFENIAFDGRASGNSLELGKIGATAGLGGLSGTGRITFAPTPSGAEPAGGLWSAWKLSSVFDLALSKLPVLQDGFPIGTARAKAHVETASAPGDTAISVAFSDGNIDLVDQKMPMTATPASNTSVRVLDWLGKVKPSKNALEGEGHLRLEVQMRTPMTMTGTGSTLGLTGRMVLDRKGTLARVEGGLQVMPGGVFHLFDNPFVIRTGIITLLGGDIAARKAADLEAAEPGRIAMRDTDTAQKALPLDIIIDVLAEGTTVDTRVATELRGPLNRPELLLASSPELPEYQILTLLITGRVDAVDEHDGEVRRQVARLVEQFHNPSLKRQLFDKLGVDKIGFGFGASVAEPILTVGRQINRRLYVESVYHHNAPEGVNTGEGRVQYRLDPHWTVNTAFGDAAAGSAGVFWRTSWGGQKRPTVGDTISLFGKRRLPTDSDGDGLADEKDKCPYEAEDRDGFRDDDGCAELDNDGDGIEDVRDAAPGKPETKNGFRDYDGVPDMVPPQIEWREGQIRTLSLEKNSAALTKASQATLEVALQALVDYPDTKVLISGHTDDKGPPALNKTLAEQRAKSVLDYLKRKGIAEERLEAQGFGSERPVDTSGTEEGRAKNRRIEMVIARISPPPAASSSSAPVPPPAPRP